MTEGEETEAPTMGRAAGGPRQLALPLGRPAPRTGALDFHVAAPNRAAHAAIRGWRGWPGGRLALVGPAGSGKSHLAAIWAEAAGGVVLDAQRLGAAPPDRPVAVEDADRGLTPEAETALFHLHNRLAEQGLALLLTARTPPARWRVGLPDLASRLAAMPLAEIGPPDDAVLSFLVVKLLADRQISAAPRVVRQLVTRMERSYEAVGRVVAALDTASMVTRRTISPGLASEILELIESDRGS